MNRISGLRGRHARVQKKSKDFDDSRKGDVNELGRLLRDVKVNKDMRRLRDVVKKVISYMTLGIDVSPLFSAMVVLAAYKDMVLKKMVYHYICFWAELYPNLAILGINTLQKE